MHSNGDAWAQDGTGARMGQCDFERLVALGQSVVENRHREGLIGFANRESQDAAGPQVILAGGGRDIAGRVFDGNHRLEGVDAGDADPYRTRILKG